MYKCQIPNCTYETNDRKCIEEHHIIPRELGGSDRAHNLIMLCPNHHTQIYIPESINGKHSVKSERYIIVHRKLMSTGGLCVECTINGELTYGFQQP